MLQSFSRLLSHPDNHSASVNPEQSAPVETVPEDPSSSGIEQNADDNNAFFEELGRQELRTGYNHYPSEILRTTSGGVLIVCSERDLTVAYYKSFPRGQRVHTITAKNIRAPAVDEACLAAGVQKPVLLNFSHFKTRMAEFFPCMKNIIIHCHAGVHRAPLMCVAVLMYGLKMDFDTCRKILETRRSVKLDEIIWSGWRDNHWHYGHEYLWQEWEGNAAAQDNTYLFKNYQLSAPR